MTGDVLVLFTGPTIVALAVMVPASVGAAFLVARSGRWGVPLGPTTAAFASTGLVLAFTLARGDGPWGFAPSMLLDWTTNVALWRPLLTDPLASDQIVLNVLLFIPAGATWTWLTRRAVRTVAGLSMLSFVIECVQGTFGFGANDPVDLVTNIVGAVIGSALATVGGWICLAPGQSRPGPRLLALTAALAATAGALGLVGATAVADRTQSALALRLNDEFAGTTLADYTRWEQTDQLPQKVFDVVSPGRTTRPTYPARW